MLQEGNNLLQEEQGWQILRDVKNKNTLDLRKQALAMMRAEYIHDKYSSNFKHSSC